MGYPETSEDTVIYGEKNFYVDSDAFVGMLDGTILDIWGRVNVNGRQIPTEGTISVKDHGAVGDGLTDDSAAFQAAVNTAGTTPGSYSPQGNYGAIVFIPKGHYRVAGLIVPPNVILYSEGPWACKLTPPVGTASTFVIKTSAYNTIKGFMIDGESEDDITLLYVAGARNYIQSMYLNQGGIGMLFSGTAEATSAHANFVSDTWVFSPSSDGIKLENFAYDNQFQTVQVANAGGHGVHFVLDGSHGGSFFTDCHIWSSTGDGIRFNGAGHRIVNCHIESNTGAGIQRLGTSVQGGAIIGCRIWHNGGGGIIFNTGWEAQIMGCEIFDNTGPGLTFTNHSQATVIGNIFADHQAPKTQTYGIVSTGTSNYIVIVGNVLINTSHLTGSHSLVGLNNRLIANVLDTGFLRGTTAQRPVPTASETGRMYFDNTLDADGKPIWWNGTAWVDATGATV